MSELSGLKVRQFERHEADLPVEFEIAPEHRAQLKYSAISGVNDPFILSTRSVDFSPGGMGLSAKNFVPRATRGTLRVLERKASGVQSDGAPSHVVIFEQAAVVRRVIMTGHEPTYFVGVSFEANDADQQRIADALDHIAAMTTAEVLDHA